MQRTEWFLFFLAAVLGAAGCSPSGQAAPLTSQAIDAALTPPAMDVLRVQARSIRHPLLPPLEIAEENGVSPEEAAVLAVLANPSLRAVRDARGLAAAQVLQAGLLPNPSLSWTNDFPYRGPDPFMEYSIGLSWDFNALIAHSAKLAAAKAQAASVDLDVAWQEWQVAQNAKASAYKLVSLEAQLAVARQAQRLLHENLQTVQKAVDLQQKTAVDLSAAEVAWQESRATVLGLERDLEKQRLAMNRLLGLPPGNRVNLRAGPSPAASPPPAAELETRLEDRRLDLLALRRGYESQEATVRAAVLGRFPKLSAGPTNARDNTKNYMFGYDISLDLPIFDRNQGAVAVEKATRQKLFDDFVNRLFEARSDIAGSIAEIESVSRQVALAESAVPMLQRLVNDYQKALNAGNADVLSYYSARSDLDKKMVEVLKLRQDLIDAWIALENASGVYLTQPPADGPGGPTTRSATQGVAK